VRRSQLERDAEKAREWLRKSGGAPARRAALERRAPLAPGRPKRREKVSDAARRKVYARSQRKCVACRRRRRLTVHHVLPVQRWPGHELDDRNMVGACADCHANHEAAARRIRWGELPEAVRRFVLDGGGDARAYAARTYPGYPPDDR
jgi:5-methylcytosine-specific restriction endonuclease McrA